MNICVVFDYYCSLTLYNITLFTNVMYEAYVVNYNHTYVYRLQSSAVLVVGLTGLTAELIKNIVLAGIKSLTLIDHRNGNDDTVHTIQGATFLLLPSDRNEHTPVSCCTAIVLIHTCIYVVLCVQATFTRNTNYSYVDTIL